MKRLIVLASVLTAAPSTAATRYVSLVGAHQPPFTNGWAAAATNIQDAVDACAGGDTVLVSNGVYAGGATWAGGWTNRLAVAQAITVAAPAGPQDTVIDGNGVRCVFLTSNALVSGFTLTNGYRYGDGGGAFIAGSGVISNCVISGNRAEDYGGGVLLERGGLVTACVLCGNVAGDFGGGVYLDEGGRIEHSMIAANDAEDGAGGSGGGVFVDTTGVVFECALVTNTAKYGAAIYLASGGQVIRCAISNNVSDFGGVYAYNGGMLDACRLCNNRAEFTGAGLDLLGAHASNCIVTGNSAGGAGGVSVYSSLLYGGVVAFNRSQTDAGGVACGSGALVDRVLIVSNQAVRYGGGLKISQRGEARNCLVLNNSASSAGGVLFYAGGVLENATVSGNVASNSGGGMRFVNAGTNRNSIVYFNTCPYPSTINIEVQGAVRNERVCSTPLPAGPGNTNANPLFVDRAAGNYELLPGSPCINTGTNRAWMAGALDFAGNPRIIDGAVDMGCYEAIPEPRYCFLMVLFLPFLLTALHGRRQPLLTTTMSDESLSTRSMSCVMTSSLSVSARPKMSALSSLFTRLTVMYSTPFFSLNVMVALNLPPAPSPL
ncbi:hypothetical protein GX586_09065 [bacterium]|nr:hypothetical protein [bacterium]